MYHKARLSVNLTFWVNGFLFANWISRIPRIQEIYGMDNGTLGLILLCASVGALVAMPFTGWVIVRNGSKKITAISSFLICLIVPFIPVFPSVFILGVVFFIMGMITGTMDVAMNAQAVLVEQQMKKPIMSSFHAVFSAGMMMGAGSGALFVHFQLAPFEHFVIAAVICLLLVVFAFPTLLPDPRQSKTEEEVLFRLPNRALFGIGLIAFCCMLGEGAISDWSTNYMEKIAFAKETIAPLGLAAFSTAMMLGRFMGDRLRTALGDGRLLLYSSLLAILGITIVLFPIHPWQVIFGFFIVGLGLAAIVPIAYSVAGNTKGLPPGVGISMVTTIGYSGFLFGPPIIGFIADWKNLQVALFFVFGLFVLMTLLSLRNKRKITVERSTVNTQKTNSF